MTIGEVLNATKEGIIGIINDPLAKNVGSSHRPGHMGGQPNYSGSSSSGVSKKKEKHLISFQGNYDLHLSYCII
jgi:hypothetical protein